MTTARAKQLRSLMTDAERRLWYRLRAHRFDGYKFKRQAPIGSYIVDFVCYNRQVIIEVDGGQHAESISDRIRDAWLTSQGFKILRFWNDDVLKRTDIVLAEIAKSLNTPLPARVARHPLPQGERGS
jgi:very-short-patch-repair endonuclease